jgi:putative redox protein
MPQELHVHAVHQGGMHFVARAGDHWVSLDYPLQPGRTAGPTPLEMLLASLAACAGSTVALLLRRMDAPLTGLEVEARGIRQDEHPTVMTEIALDFTLRGAGLDPGAVARALRIAEEQLCPVWAMLKTGTAISASFRMMED